MSHRRSNGRGVGSLAALHQPVLWAVEALERRVLLAAVSWTGGGDGVNWTDPKNWSTGALPGSADTVTINAAGNPTIMLASGSQSVSSLTTSDPLTIASGATLALGTTIGGSGTLTNAGTLTLNNTTVNAPLVNQGTIVVTNTSNSIAGTFTASAGSTLSLNDSNSYAFLTVSNSFTNDGTIALSTTGTQGYSATLTVPSGSTLTNASDGTISASGTGTDRLTINGAVAATAGTLSFASGQTLKFGNGTLTLGAVTLSGTGTLDASNDTVAVAGTFTQPAGTVQLNLTSATVNGPGTLTNAGTLKLNNTTINAPLVNHGTVAVTGTSNTIAGTFTASAGSTLSLNDNNNYAFLTVSSSFTNDGTIALSTTGTQGYAATLTVSSGSTLTNASDGTISASGTGTDLLTINGAVAATAGTLSIAAGQKLKFGNGTLTLGAVTLSGTGTLDASNDTVAIAGTFTLPAGVVQLNLTSATVNGTGTLANAGTLTLNSTTINAPLVNQGTLVVMNTSNTIAGTFTASAGSTLKLDDNNNYALLTVSNSFTNDGTIALSTESKSGYSVTLTISSGSTLTDASDGTISASGTGTDPLTINGALAATAGTVSIAAGQTLKVGGSLTLGAATLSGTGTLDASNDTVTLAGNFTLPAAAVKLNLTNATVNGPGILTNAGTLTLNNTKVNAPLVNQGTMVVTSTGSTITGAFTASAGSTLIMDDNTNYALLTISSSFTNDGTIALSTESINGYYVTLTISSGSTLTNASDGTITASGTGTDLLSITGAVTNKGTLSAQHALTVNNASDTFDATSGTLSIAAGKTLTISSGTLTLGSTALSGTGTLNVSGDTVNLSGNQTLTSAGVQVVLTNATVNGPGILTNAGTLTLNNTKVNATLVNQGTLVVTSTGSTITGAFTASAGSTLSMDDNSNYSFLTVSNSFTNDGTIALSTEASGGYYVTLTISSGSTLTNASDGTITASGTGTDQLSITGAVTNKGTLSVQHALTVNNSSDTFDATSGTLSIAAGKSLAINSGTLVLGSTALSGTGTLNAAGDIVNLSGNQTLTAAGVQVVLTNATVNGPGILTNAAGNTLTLSNTKVNAPLVNQGTMVVTSSGNTIAGAFTASAGSTLSMDDNSNYSLLTVSSSFTNDGTIALSTEASGGYYVTLTISSGSTLTNAADGTITASGSGTDQLSITGAVTNKGTLSVQHALTVNNSSDTFDATSGTLSIAAGKTLTINSGTLMLGSTALSGTGTLNVTGDTVNLAGNQTLTAAGVQVILTNATVNGPGILINAGTLTLNNTKVNAPLVNQGTIVVTSSGNTITGAFTASAGSTLSMDDNSNYSFLTVSNSFTNDGTIALSTEATGGYSVTLTMSSGATLTNASDGTITASGSGTDTLTLNGALSNQGTLSVKSVKLTVQNPTNLASNVLTGGTWKVSSGGKLVLPTTITTNAANIALDGQPSIITNSGGTTNALSGLTADAHSGSLTLTGGQVLAATPSGGTFTNDGTLTVGPASELSVTGAFVQNADGTLSVQIGGATSANFGQIVATGTATAGGALQGSFVNSYDPPATQTFAVLNGASESGTFAGTVAGVTPSGRTLIAHYNATSALIAVLPLAPSAPFLTAASDSGVSQTDGITNDNTPTFTGTASDAGTVQLYSDGTLVGTATVGAGGGAWSIQSSLLADGHHVITAAVLDTASDLGPLATGPTILIDTVAPTIHATISAPGSTGWYNIASGPADVHYVASDNPGGSGLASAVPPDHIFSDGANQSLAGVTISDIAGNTATSESFSGIKQDTVAPTIHATINAPAASGWYNIASGPADVHYVASDNAGGSGLASSVPPDHVFADGSNQSLAGVTISDVAGNTATSESFSGIKQDTVAPTIHATINAPAATGWYNIASGPADVHYVASDNAGGSGLASSVPADHVFADGSSQSLAGVTISDVAGNTATSESFSGIKQDTVPPTSAVAALPSKEGGPFTLNWSGQDNAGGSGLAGYSVYVSDNGGPYTALVQNTTSTSRQFTGQVGHTYGFYSVATDVAGNVQPAPTSAQATTTVTGPPAVTSISPGTGPAAGGTTVTINGVGFTQATVVDFGSTPASSFTVNSAGTQIMAVDPAGSGTVDVTVTTPDGTTAISAADKFVYALPTWLAAGSVATWNLSTHTLTVTGSATIIADPGADEPNIVASGAAAKIAVTPATSPTDVHVGGITLSTGASLTMTSVGASRSHSNHNVLVIGAAGVVNDPTISVDSSSKIDLADNDLIVHTGSSDHGNGTLDQAGVPETNALINVQALAATGRGVAAGSVLNGTWAGNGLTSSSAASVDKAAGFEQNVLAVVQNSDQILGSDSKWTVGSASESLGANDILVKYTYNGDAALEGKVLDNSVTIVNGFYDAGKTTQADWAFGDFTGNGKVDDNDITILNGLYGLGTGGANGPQL